MMDIVMPYRQGYQSPEIFWAVKSFVKNMPHRSIYVIGDDPRIDGVFHVEPEYNPWARDSKYHDQINSYLTAANLPFLTRDFIAVNDDFFIMQPWEPVIYNQGNLADHIKRRVRNDQYRRSLHITKKYLESQQLPTIDYELHTPFVFDRFRLKALIKSLDMKAWQYWSIRSLYGNAYHIPSQFSEDVKNPKDYKGKVLLSTTKSSFKREIGDYIKEQLS